MRDDDTAAAETLGFDPEALRQKYEIERDKRLRDDANEQFVEIAGQYAHYLDDPYVAPGFTRPPLLDEVDVLVLGGGFAGLQVAGRLREAGVEKIRIVEKGGDFGGTWYWNRYPGAACDIESYIYLPYLEELGYIPSRKYAGAPEILEHSRAIARHFDLYRDVCFQTEVEEFRWEEETASWLIRTNRNDAFRARFICVGSGPLHRPKLPGIPGIETFEGHSFHTSRWDYEYTGGDWSGNLTNLQDKRVGVIGTGATAVQCIPHLGKWSKQLTVFQRTPSGVDVRSDRPTDPDWARTLTPGWQKRRMDNFEAMLLGIPQEEDLVADGWTDLTRYMALMAGDEVKTAADPAHVAEMMQLADFRKMEEVRKRVEDTVHDGPTAEALKPYYNRWCKRPCFHDEYLPTFNLPNVQLVDTNGAGVDRITANAVIVNGQAYEVDCLIYATGFEVGTGFTHRMNSEIIGRNGATLTDRWSDGPKTFQGIMANEFPNCFFLVPGLQSAATFNVPYITDIQSKHIARIIADCLTDRVKSIEIKSRAVDSWQDEMARNHVFREDFFRQCTPSYYNNEGKIEGAGFFKNIYGAGPFAYAALLSSWLESDFKADMTITR